VCRFHYRIKLIRDENLEMPDDFNNELYKWALECKWEKNHPQFLDLLLVSQFKYSPQRYVLENLETVVKFQVCTAASMKSNCLPCCAVYSGINWPTFQRWLNIPEENSLNLDSVFFPQCETTGLSSGWLQGRRFVCFISRFLEGTRKDKNVVKIEQ
jgi:hypothetical protein